MATVTLTTDKFDEVARSADIVLIDFWAAWCGPCRRFAPVFEESSDKHGDIVFAKVDTEAEPALSERFGIASIPTLMAIREGVIVYAEPGALPAPMLESVIEQVRALDMADVRARMNS
ncbi:thioredoxin [Actinomadura kijaniata]|uniref:Thioredoxin n=1 Tax=Actinomadura namibiensis TaxID=182080 RepID=A0A7W3LZ74_ACTNM|nr:thioredoxin [Actinomadura namibiensis]MBA8956919.1 thioredoxin 1 [Actinomadura namibiensis]